MPVTAARLRAMQRAEVDLETIIKIVEAEEAAEAPKLAERRLKDAERKRASRMSARTLRTSRDIADAAQDPVPPAAPAPPDPAIEPPAVRGQPTEASSLSKDSDSPKEATDESKKAKQGSRRVRARARAGADDIPWPDDFALDDDMRKVAADLGWTDAPKVERMWMAFHDNALMKGRMCASLKGWKAAWRMWCNKQVDFEPARRSTGPPVDTTQQAFAFPSNGGGNGQHRQYRGQGGLGFSGLAAELRARRAANAV